VVNGGEQVHNGLEVSARFNLVDNKTGFVGAVTPFVNYTFADYEYKNYKFQTGTTTANIKTFDFSGSPVAGVSKHVFSTGVDFLSNTGLYGNIVYLYRDRMPITSPDTLYASSYNLVNAKIGFRKRLSNHFELDASFGIDNLTGVKYPMMIFVNQLPDAYIAAPRDPNYFAGLRVLYIL
jgi:iron complex outermembrane receptor protein